MLLVLEARRTLIRLAREGRLPPARYQSLSDRVSQDASHFILRDLTLELCQSTSMPPILTARSLDLVHLRTALWFHAIERIDSFVTLDSPQAQAARELGLPA